MRSALAALFAGCLSVAPAAAEAPDHAAIARRAVEAHILPGYAALSAATEALEAKAAAFCAGDAARATLDAAYHAAFDAWMGVAHLRFGPSEAEDRAFAIAFWPDSRGVTPRQVEALLRDVALDGGALDGGALAGRAPGGLDAAAFAERSVAARGLFALDYLLFDPERGGAGPGAPRCRLLRLIAGDLAAGAVAIEADWRDGYADLLRTPGPENPVYLSGEEATRQLFGALATGLEAAIDLRLGRPLGTFDRPRPRRAEAWRSRRPLRNLALSVAALADLAEAAFAPEIDADAAADLSAAFDRAALAIDRAPRPMVEAVADPARRVRVEAARTALGDLRAALARDVGGALGVTLGFNALDGD